MFSEKVNYDNVATECPVLKLSKSIMMKATGVWFFANLAVDLNTVLLALLKIITFNDVCLTDLTWCLKHFCDMCRRKLILR